MELFWKNYGSARIMRRFILSIKRTGDLLGFHYKVAVVMLASYIVEPNDRGRRNASSWDARSDAV